MDFLKSRLYCIQFPTSHLETENPFGLVHYLMTQFSISGHKEGIAGVTWMESATEVITCSWDHTIRIWDAEMATLKTELVGNKAFFDVSYSPEKKMLLAASCERTIRMYDPRSSEGKISST